MNILFGIILHWVEFGSIVVRGCWPQLSCKVSSCLIGSLLSECKSCGFVLSDGDTIPLIISKTVTQPKALILHSCGMVKSMPRSLLSPSDRHLTQSENRFPCFQREEEGLWLVIQRIRHL